MKHVNPEYDRIQDPENLIPEDEPVMLIRAQDLAGPETLRAYATFAAIHGVDRDDIQKVILHAEIMEKWQREHAAKVADVPAEPTGEPTTEVVKTQ